MKNLQKKLNNFINNTRKPYKWEWFVLGVLILIPFVSCFYGDTQSIVLYESDFFGSILDGGGMHFFYDYVMNRVDTTGVGNYATYDFFVYIVLGIWGAPLWFLMGAEGNSPINSFAAKIYGKSILLAALIITAIIIYLICRELKIEKEAALWGAFIYVSSVLVYVAVCLNGQTDIMGIIFILSGLLSYIKGRNNWFIVFFALAVPFKQYALFVFVPLLLLKEKRIGWIAGKTLAVLSLTAAGNMLFDTGSSAIQIKKAFELNMFHRLMAQRLPLLDGGVSPVVVFMAAICVFCYVKQIDDKEELDRYSIFIPLLTMGCVFISFESSSYWYVHLVPFLAIMLVYNAGNFRHCILFESIGMISLVLANYADRPWSFEIHHYTDMLPGIIFGNYNTLEAPVLLGDFCVKTGITKYCGTLFGIYIVLLFSVIYVSRPSNMKRGKIKEPIRGYAMLRLALNTLVAYIPGFLYLYNVYLAGKQS